MAGTLKVVSDRIKSVSNIQKITKSMKMVSVAKFGRAERLLKTVKQFGLGNQALYEKLSIQPKDEEVIYFAITSDRGLCGGCHSSVAKSIMKSFTKDAKFKLVCIGEKGRSILNYKYGDHIILVVKDIGKKPPTFIDASMITLGLRGMGWFNRYWVIVYNCFINMMSYETKALNLTNFKGVLESKKLFPYDEIDEEIVEYYVQFSKVSLLYYTMVEAQCNEHTARMNAMENASKNAMTMIQKLRLRFNRGRQANITKELIEIISGASALQGRD